MTQLLRLIRQLGIGIITSISKQEVVFDGTGCFQYFVETLDRIKVVIIFLDDAQDENSVFESINSLGKPLSGSDLIKNFLFTFKNYQCSHNEEKVLTDIYTRNFESLFSAENDVENQLEIFFRQYIALKTNELVNQDPKVIYYSFKKLVGDIGGFEECKNLIKDITKWGIIFQTIRANSNKDIHQNYIGYLKSSFLTYATLLMDIVEKCSNIENGTVVVKDEDKLMLNETLRKVVAYDVCRFLGGFPAKQITRFTPTIPKDSGVKTQIITVTTPPLLKSLSLLPEKAMDNRVSTGLGEQSLILICIIE